MTTRQVCMIIGDPVAQSRSPAMHTAGYRALGIEDRFVFVAARVTPKDLADCVAGARAMSFRGLTCTIPHKQAVIEHLDELSDDAREIGAVNTVVNDNGRLVGYNTDWFGVVQAIEKRRQIAGTRALVIGAGGTSRSAVYGLAKRGAAVTVANRSKDSGKLVASDFGAEFLELGAISSLDRFDLIVNTTPVGMGELAEETPLPGELFGPGQTVLDAVYKPAQTKLLRDAESRGAKAIAGLEMLLYQGLEQFRLYTGMPAPEAAMREALGLEKQRS